MKRDINKLLMMFALPALLVLAGCERDYDAPRPEVRLTDQNVVDQGYQIVPISEIKQIYYDEFGRNTIGQGIEITRRYAIKGKVISNDEQNNVYQVMYIQDETGGIEIKLGSYSNFIKYPPGNTVYVLLDNMILGNYRYNLSIGAPSSPGSDYANDNMTAKFLIRDKVKLGEDTRLTAADTTVVTSPDQLNDDMIGSLIRFEGLTSRWGITLGEAVAYPQFLQSIYSNSGATQYANYAFVDVIEAWQQYIAEVAIWEAAGGENSSLTRPTQPVSPRPGSLEYPTYAFSQGSDKYYGSAWFEFGTPSATDPNHNLILRTSGHANFALYRLPADGRRANITAIYNKYSASSGGFIKYQLLLNKVEDIVLTN